MIILTIEFPQYQFDLKIRHWIFSTLKVVKMNSVLISAYNQPLYTERQRL
jgi:hypothetical protein